MILYCLKIWSIESLWVKMMMKMKEIWTLKSNRGMCLLWVNEGTQTHKMATHVEKNEKMEENIVK